MTSDNQDHHAFAHAHDHDGHGRGPADHHRHGAVPRGHAPASFGRAFLIGIGLNTGFLLLEAVFGLLSNSVSLLADAGHNLSDVLGLVVAYGATLLSARRPTARFTYGMKGSSILAGLFNAVLLLVVLGGLAWEALQRLAHPQPVAGGTVIVVAAAGIVVNGVSAWLFAAGSKTDVNIRGAFIHMAGDALVSAGVVVSGLLILLTGWTRLDPLTSLIVNAVIVVGTWRLLYDSLCLSLQAVPAGIEPGAVRAFIASQPGVGGLHDLHIWPMSTTETALSAHVEMPEGHPGDAFLHRLSADLEARFAISHVTIQIESAAADCQLAAAGHDCFTPASAL